MAYKQICNVLPGNVVHEISSFIHEKPYKQLMFKLMAQEELKHIRATLYFYSQSRKSDMFDFIIIVKDLYETLRCENYDYFMINVRDSINPDGMTFTDTYWCVPFDIDRKDFYSYLDSYDSWRLDKWAEIIEKNKQKRLNLLTYIHMCHTFDEYEFIIFKR